MARAREHIVPSDRHLSTKLVSTAGTFHTHLKYSIVQPLFKKGNRENMANFRLISLLT
jgi:hypothetical protein